MAVTIANYSINGANPSTVGGTGTAIKYFPNLPGPSIGVANTTPSSTSSSGQLLVPGNNQLNGQPFSVLASGNITAGSGGGSTTITVAIYANTAAVGVTPSYTTLATGSFAAEVVDGVAYPFSIKMELEGDSGSGIVQGTQFVLIDNVVETATAAISHALTGINFATNPPFGLVCGVTFGTSESGNSASLYRFSIEA